MKIGFIGLGNMGKPMARNLLKAGFELTVFNRTAAVARELEAEGAKVASSPSDLTRQVDVVLMCVSNDAALEEVVTGPDGVLKAAREQTTIVDHSTVSPDLSKRLAAAAADLGAAYLDAPVSGGTVGAEAGTLTFMIGGAESHLDRVRPVLAAMGKAVFHCGDVGAGNIAKLVNNYVGAINLMAAIEGMVMGVKAGVDAKTLQQVVVASTGSSKAFEFSVPNKILKRDFEPGFSIDLLLKDLHLAEDLARAVNTPIPAGSVVVQQFVEACCKGLGNSDTSAMAKPLEELTGVILKGD
jgi:3-hydroxyisobutyrate dehydrogenase